MSHFDIDRYLDMKLKNRVSRVGVELEGGWDELPKFEHGEKLERDGSVRIDPPKVKATQNANRPFDLRAALDAYNRLSTPNGQIYVDGGIEERLVDQRFRDYRDRPIGYGVGQEFIAGLQRNGNFKQIHIGEIAGPPLEVGKVADWVRKCYPQHVNQTCGLHVHLSFKKSLHYSRLMTPEYQATMINYLTKWAIKEKIEKEHPLWNRLCGKNEFCKLEFFADVQARKPNKIYDHHGLGNRYTAINYCHAQHGTIECRVLPMFEDKEVAVKAIEEVINITNACLKAEAKKEEIISAQSIEDSVNGVIREHRRELV